MRIAETQGAVYQCDGKTRFRTWAPRAQRVELRIAGGRRVELERREHGYFEASVDAAPPGTRYKFVLDGKEWPDPSSRSQPDGVHADSEVVDSFFPWTDDHWAGIELQDYVIYELHVGTFTPEGTFEAIIPHLQYLKDLGVTAIELMPIAEFPGGRNWGYDGAYPYAAQSTYGGVAGLKKLVDAAHAAGLAVVLDVVYNHLGPEGNYHGLYGHYYTDCYKTPWGTSMNYDGPHSDEVRAYFIGNALYWVEECHIDALRLDAVHAIVDTSAISFMRELGEAVHDAAARLERKVYVIAENDRNDPAFARPVSEGGQGLDAQWADDFHHALHTVLTGERTGYYAEFGALEQLGRAFTDGYVFAGSYSPHRQRKHGAPAEGLEGKRFVVCCQNHDQVGNRMLGDRISGLVDFRKQKLAAAAMLLSPYIPLLFMGEEYGETAPFQYFVSHGDPQLVESVRKGRIEEFAAFQTTGKTTPDPQSEETFARSRLNHALRAGGQNRQMLEFYRTLLRLRRQLPSLRSMSRKATRVEVDAGKQMLVLRRGADTQDELIAVFNFSDTTAHVDLGGRGKLKPVLDSDSAEFGGASQADPEKTPVPSAVAVHPFTVMLFAVKSSQSDVNCAA